MSSTIADLNLVASGWAGAVGRACWQGGLAIGLVWGLCRVLPRLSGRVQCWLWRLAYLKLLVALLWGAPLCLPLLPSPPSLAPLAAPGSRLSALGSPLTPPTALRAVPPPRRGEGVALGGDEGQGVSRTALNPVGPRAEHREPSAAPQALRGLLLLWLLGVAAVGAQVLGDWRRTQRLRIQAGAVRDEALLTDCCALSRRLGVRQAPALLTAEDLSCPVLVGVAHPAVLLPASFPAQFTPSQMRLMLAHELAHLKRRDLLWAWLPSLARVLFFFHPLVWLAEGEWRMAQEMACDEQVVLSTGTSQARYGAMLLEVMGEPRRSFPASLLTAGVAESYATIRRRLVAIQRVRAVSRQRWALTGLCLAAAGTAAVVPWRLTVRPAAVDLAASPGGAPSARRSVLGAPRSAPTFALRAADGQLTAPARRLTKRLAGAFTERPELSAERRLAAPRLQPPHGPRPPETSRSAAVPSTGASHSSVELARLEADRRGRGGLIAGQQDGDPSLTGAPDANGIDAPPAPVEPGPKDWIGKQPPHEPFEAVVLPGKEPSSVFLVETLRDEDRSRPNWKELAFSKEPEFRKRAGILLMPKTLASQATPLGWSPSPLLRRPGPLTLRIERKIDPRDLLKKLLAQARQEGTVDPKLAAQIRSLDPRVLKKMLAQAFPTPAKDTRSVDDETLMAFKRSLAEAHTKEALDTGLPDAKWMPPPDKELLRSKKLEQLKREAEENRTKEIRHDGSVDEGVPDR
jgi:beta-lactamase regulating signal transducer with metallopeptidase domain